MELNYQEKGKVIIIAKKKEDLKDEMRTCRYCGEELLASTNKDVSQFGSYEKKKQGAWYYQSNCIECQREAVRIKSSNRHINTEQMKEHLRAKRILDRENRRWSIYKITIDLTGIERRLKQRFIRWHQKYFYVGITKREPRKRWNEHLYDLKKGSHCNEIMQAVYSKVRKAYPALDDNEFQEVFGSDIMSFEVLKTLDNNMTEYEAHIHEEFEIKALEYELFYGIKDSYNTALINKESKKEISYLKDEMLINLEHCKSSTSYLKEIHEKDKKITPCAANTRVIK
ncbi:hypothetical protein [Paraclostridium bifermentans]|uniref:hypothetical protein n=1 Tax=Paraclostridium bifermentans TaxID=1490 RepID=UPI0011DE35F0|nr:hypothetical protein [Paraclostridium bifermentans]